MINNRRIAYGIRDHVHRTPHVLRIEASAIVVAMPNIKAGTATAVRKSLLTPTKKKRSGRAECVCALAQDKVHTLHSQDGWVTGGTRQGFTAVVYFPNTTVALSTFLTDCAMFVQGASIVWGAWGLHVVRVRIIHMFRGR